MKPLEEIAYELYRRLVIAPDWFGLEEGVALIRDAIRTAEIRGMEEALEIASSYIGASGEQVTNAIRARIEELRK